MNDLPAGVRKHPNGNLWMPKENAVLESMLDSQFTRVGPLEWKPIHPLLSGEPAPKNIFQKAASFVTAVTSGEAPDDVFKARLALCQACPKLVTRAEGTYCGACGCGQHRWSELNTKLKMGKVDCPLKKFPLQGL